MPFLPLYFQTLGLRDVGEIALWSGLSLGVTPALTALLSPFWGRLADRYGRKIMVERSLFSFIVVMGGMAFVTRPWHVFALRAVQGFFAGYGALTLTMAADSAPRDRMASAIGTVQTAQRLGPAIGPIIGGAVAQLVGLRWAFFVTAVFYVIALVLVFVMYDEQRSPSRAAEGPDHAAVVPQRSGVRELHSVDGGDLRPAVRRPQLRPGAAAVRDRTGDVRRARARLSPVCCSRSAPEPGPSGTTSAARCCAARRRER